MLKLDIGCGKNKKGPDWIGVDAINFDGVDVQLNAGTDKWPWEDSSVDEVHASHFLEHLTNFEGKWERVHFFNELWRVLKPGATATLIFPHWASQRYYGDPTHKEPFSEFGFYYLDKTWRTNSAPHTDIEFNPNGYSCDLECTWGHSLHPDLNVRSADYRNHAMSFYIEARQDTVATVKARKSKT